MKKILFLTTLNDTRPLKEALDSIKREYGEIVRVTKVYLDEYERPDIPLDPLREAIAESDIILIDIRGDIRVLRELRPLIKASQKTIVVLLGASPEILSLTKMGRFRGEMMFKEGTDREFSVHTYVKTKKFSNLSKKLAKICPFGILKDLRNWLIAQEYYTEGGVENLKRLILFLIKNYGGVKAIKRVDPPETMPPFGLYLPGKGIYRSLDSYKRDSGYKVQRPTVGLLMYGGMHFYETRIIADALYEKLKDDVNLLFVFSKVEHNIEAINTYLKNIELFISLQYFRIHGGPYGGEPDPTYRFLTEVNVPFIVPLRAFETSIEEWSESKEGLSPLEQILGVTLPELDGAIEPIFVAGMDEEDDEVLGKVKSLKVLDDRVEKLVERVKKWLKLRQKPNREKKIAIVIYDYPPGEENLGSAGYLDVFESLKFFLRKLKENGYEVEVPEGDLKEILLLSGAVNSPMYVGNERTINLPVERYLEWYNSLPERVRSEVERVWGKSPGNLMVDRGGILIPGIVLRNVFIGVQPSRGVREDPEKSYHDKDLPPHHQYIAFYKFIEKEFKADAVIHFGMHGTLEFLKGKEFALSSWCFPDFLVGNIPHLYFYWIGNPSESTIAKRRSYALCISHASPPMVSSGLYEDYLVLEDLLSQFEESQDEETLNLIKELCNKLHLPEDLTQAKKELYRMKRRLIPYGLHVMDRTLKDEELLEYLLGVLRIDREYPSILKLIARKMGYSLDNLEDVRILEDVEAEARVVIDLILKGFKPDDLPEGYVEFVRETAEKAKGKEESKNLIRALNGEYILPKRAGDPIRDPDVYPSGYAMYGLDPRLIPTIQAQRRGERAVGLMLNSFIQKYGRYPESVGVVLWGFETMKTGGDTIAMVLSLLGVRLEHRKNPWFKELKVIPLEELKRPRIDVSVTICGIFRDTFPQQIDLINRAVKMVSGLDEPVEMNFVRKHYLEWEKELGEFALARVFGPSPSEYATSVRTLIETGNWSEEKELVEHYDDSLSYAYFNGRVENQREAFNRVLKSIELVAQERDNVEYEVTDLDHYYEFLGGLARSVREKRGTDVDVLVVDSTEEELLVEGLEVSIERAVRTRLLNPRWIEGMLNHNFHGGKLIKDRFENLLGFSATTGKVENWIYDELMKIFISNEKVRERLIENNPYAAVKIGEILVESAKRGYWKTKEETLEQLRNFILGLEGYLE